SNQPESRDKSSWLNWMNGGRRPTIALNSTKSEQKRWHDKRIKIKQFKAGDKVLLFNSRVRLFGHGKLRSKWEGPFLVLNATDHSAITLQDDDGNVFKANGQRLKIFLEPEIPELEEVD